MATTQSTLVAVFNSASDAQAAVRDLQQAGITSGDIQVYSNPQSSGTNMETGSITGTGHEGGFTGWLKSIFSGDENEHSAYGKAYDRGGTVVAVSVPDDQVDATADLLDRHNPEDLQEQASVAGAQEARAQDVRTQDARAEQIGSPTAAAMGGTSAAAAAAGTAATQGARSVSAGTAPRAGSVGAGSKTTVPVVREDFTVGKRSFQRGGVRVYSKVVEEPVEENVRLREEHARVNRTPVDRPATEADLRGGAEQVIEVGEYAEEPVIQKRARVVEEVSIGKDVNERSETVRDTVRHTEINVTPISETPTAGRDTAASLQNEDFRQHFQENYGNVGGSFETFGPAYEYGHSTANDPRYKGRRFADVEQDLRTDYERRNPNSNWDRIKGAVQYGWDRVSGKV